MSGPTIRALKENNSILDQIEESLSNFDTEFKAAKKPKNSEQDLDKDLKAKVRSILFNINNLLTTAMMGDKKYSPLRVDIETLTYQKLTKFLQEAHLIILKEKESNQEELLDLTNARVPVNSKTLPKDERKSLVRPPVLFEAPQNPTLDRLKAKSNIKYRIGDTNPDPEPEPPKTPARRFSFFRRGDSGGPT